MRVDGDDGVGSGRLSGYLVVLFVYMFLVLGWVGEVRGFVMEGIHEVGYMC
jgi:hypothetical protein